MIRRIFVIECEEPAVGWLNVWLNVWNLALAIEKSAPGGRPYEVAEITTQLSKEAMDACLLDSKQKTNGFRG